jgi:hypothetical protein
MAVSTNELANKTIKAWGRPSWWHLLIALPWTIGLFFFLHSSATDRAIADRERTTYGIVRTNEPANHDRYGYDFVVNGKLYTGWQIPSREEFTIGQRVLVYYDPLDPTKSTLNSYADTAENVQGPVVFCAFGITAVAIFIFVRRRTTAQSRRQSNVP